MQDLKCTYLLCECKATKVFDLQDLESASCDFHFEVRCGEALKTLEDAGLIIKTWDEESKQFLYNSTSLDGFQELD